MSFHLLSVYEIYHKGHSVARLAEALRYKPEGRGFDSQWGYWNFSGRTIALGSTQPLTDISNKDLLWGVKAAGAYG